MTKKENKKKPTYVELENYAKRLQADFENYKKRTQKDRAEYAQFANTDLILQILPVMDNFRLAVHHLPKELQDNTWVAGVRHIETQLEHILRSEGVESIETVGHQFDPYLHEAIEEVESEKPPGEIVEEVQHGYSLAAKVIRPAKVKVSAIKQRLDKSEQKEIKQ
jgi:molecular chaperone GrpE